jgi:dihydroxyacetone kinase
MKKIINEAADFVDETMEGIIAAYGDKVNFHNGDKRILISAYPKKKGKVGIVTGGGSGHLPVFLGYVGSGMLDGCAVGNVFASPSYQKMAELIRVCDSGSGVLCLYGNYGGDKMNFNQAIEDVEFNKIKTMSLLVADDVASGNKTEAEKRRGIAGMVYAFKIAGAAADSMYDLAKVAELTGRALNNIRSIGVALSPCIVPEVGNPTFSIEEDEMEIGMGIHGEKGISIDKMTGADMLAERLLKIIDNDMPLKAGDEVSVMINGLGATPLEEQFIVYRKIYSLLREKCVSVFMPHIGEFATSMEMAGFSVTIFKLDEELKNLLEYPVKTPFYTNYNK